MWIKNFCWIALVPLLIGLAACGKSAADTEAAARQEAYREKYAKAKALFEERCKAAGVVIKRTVKDVEGIELTKIRQPISWAGREYLDPMYSEAAMAGENRGDDYIKQFLMTEFRYRLQPDRRGGLGPGLLPRDSRDLPPIRGYRFVEYVDNSGSRFRCAPTWKEGDTNWSPGQHHCEQVKQSATKYSLDYEDLADPNDRALWIAGTRLKVIDKQTGEVVAELKRFVWDEGFGNASTGRWPWAYANSRLASVCPGEDRQPLNSVSRYFADTVLIPKQGD